MKSIFLMILIYTSLYISGTCFYNQKDKIFDNKNSSIMAIRKIKITVNSQTFTATVLDNNSARAFMELLPLTIKMTELNGNEKYYDLSKKLPTKSTNPGTIRNGDLMLYGSNTLVLFYKTFSSPYSYSKIGSIDDPTGLQEALGTGNVNVALDNI